MVKPEWGTKRTCPKCSTRFYDLGNEEPVHCIECGTEWVPEPVLKSKQPMPFEAAAAEAKGSRDRSGPRGRGSGSRRGRRAQRGRGSRPGHGRRRSWRRTSGGRRRKLESRARGTQIPRLQARKHRLRRVKDRGRSSAGRASQWHCEGQGFDPPRLHHPSDTRPKGALSPAPFFSAANVCFGWKSDISCVRQFKAK